MFGLRADATALAIAALSALVLLGAGPARAAGPAKFTAKGELVLPQNYREWVMVGTQVTPNELNNGKAPFTETRIVYVDREGFAHWKRTGQFKDGTMMVKELVSIGAREGAGSGKGFFMGDYYGLEASVKDAKRFPNEPGNWAYYIFSLPDKALVGSAKNFPTAECAACHKASAKDDMVFTQYYPVLRAAKGTNVSGVRLAK